MWKAEGLKMYETAEAQKINEILGKKIFTSGTVEDAEVLKVTGLTIEQLSLCWIFSTRNEFTKALKDWQDSGKLMDYCQIQRHI